MIANVCRKLWKDKNLERERKSGKCRMNDWRALIKCKNPAKYLLVYDSQVKEINKNHICNYVHPQFLFFHIIEEKGKVPCLCKSFCISDGQWYILVLVMPELSSLKILKVNFVCYREMKKKIMWAFFYIYTYVGCLTLVDNKTNGKSIFWMLTKSHIME